MHDGEFSDYGVKVWLDNLLSLMASFFERLRCLEGVLLSRRVRLRGVGDLQDNNRNRDVYPCAAKGTKLDGDKRMYM